MRSPEISICIPAYRHISFVKRLLDSIAMQTFTDYEIILSDDSPDEDIRELLKQYNFTNRILYVRNDPALGTPANWNAAIRYAQGTWIKLMHQDDWFQEAGALQAFSDATRKYPGCSFFFSAFQNVVQDTDKIYPVRCNFFDRLFLRLSPLHLFKRVYVGNPSCTLARRDTGIFYDTRFRFVVDFEYYIRFICSGNKYRYIDKLLLNIGFHEDQVTRYTFLVPSVQIPENCMLIGKLGARILRNPVVYDYYWRMFRNLKIRTLEDVARYYQAGIPRVLEQMLRFQAQFSLRRLQNGFLSKCLMTVSYVRSLFTAVK